VSVTFSPLYRQTFEPVVDRGRVRQTVQEADRQSFHELGDRTYGLFARRFGGDGRPPFYVWALCTVDEGVHLVYCALAMLASLDDRIDALSPLEMLRAFLQEFGLPVQSEFRVSKLIYNETFWMATREPADVWTVPDKPERYFLGSWTIMERFGVSTRIESHFVFAIDLDKYEEWLAPLDLAPPRGRKRKRRR
jgi:hypothetical protein